MAIYSQAVSQSLGAQHQDENYCHGYFNKCVYKCLTTLLNSIQFHIQCEDHTRTRTIRQVIKT